MFIIINRLRKKINNNNNKKHFSSKQHRLDYLREIGSKFYEKIADFSSQLGMIKCSEIRHFSMKFSFEGEFWQCHFVGNKMGASN